MGRLIEMGRSIVIFLLSILLVILIFIGALAINLVITGQLFGSILLIIQAVVIAFVFLDILLELR